MTVFVNFTAGRFFLLKDVLPDNLDPAKLDERQGRADVVIVWETEAINLRMCDKGFSRVKFMFESDANILETSESSPRICLEKEQRFLNTEHTQLGKSDGGKHPVTPRNAVALAFPRSLRYVLVWRKTWLDVFPPMESMVTIFKLSVLILRYHFLDRTTLWSVSLLGGKNRFHFIRPFGTFRTKIPHNLNGRADE